MAFCKSSTEKIAEGKTLIDNMFITQYLPYLPHNAAKAYLFGTFLCQGGSTLDNTAADFCKNAQLTQDQLDEALEVLKDEGLCEIVGEDHEKQVVFNTVSMHLPATKKFNKSKYADFNRQIQEILKSRQILPYEFEQYYGVIETLHMEPDALLLVAKYCVDIKGAEVGHRYITRVAKNFAYAEARTAGEVSAKLLEQERSMGKIKELLMQMKIARAATMEERETYLRWKKQFRLSDALILFAQNAAHKCDNFEKLDKVLMHYDALGLGSEKEIEAYEKTRKAQFETAKEVVKQLGLYYQNSEPVVEQYVSKWFNLGYEKDFLTSLAKTCFTQGVRTLEVFNDRVNAMFNKGVLDAKSLGEFSNEVAARDNEIKKVLKAAGLDRAVSNFDRSVYNTWVTAWGFKPDVILAAAKQAAGGVSPMALLSKILQGYKETSAPKRVSAAKEKRIKEDDRHSKILMLREQSAEFKKLDDDLRRAQIKGSVPAALAKAHEKFLTDAGI